MPTKISNINRCDIPSNKKEVKCIQNVYTHNSSLGSYLDILFKMFIILFIFFILNNFSWHNNLYVQPFVNFCLLAFLVFFIKTKPLRTFVVSSIKLYTPSTLSSVQYK